MLLHNGNLFGAIPIGHCVYLKEKHGHIKVVLDLLKYDDHEWIICVDLKMVNFLIGNKDSRAKDKHWEQKLWPVKKSLTVGEKSIIHQPLASENHLPTPSY